METEYYGRGWAFPVAFTVDGVTTATGVDDIEQSLLILFNTLPGERVMRPEFGCDLPAMMFRNINASLRADIQNRIMKAVALYEPRVMVDEVLVEASAHDRTRIHIQIIYRLSGSDTVRMLGLGLVDGKVVHHE